MKFDIGDWVYIDKGIKSEITGYTGDYDQLTHYLFGRTWKSFEEIHKLNGV